MRECKKEAALRQIALRKFSLQDCRSKGVSDKLEAVYADTLDATLHSDGKMIAKVYDRRQSRRAKPAA